MEIKISVCTVHMLCYNPFIRPYVLMEECDITSKPIRMQCTMQVSKYTKQDA